MADLIDQVAPTMFWEDTDIPDGGAMKLLTYTPGPEAINPEVEEMVRKELGSRVVAKANAQGIIERSEYMALMHAIAVDGELVVDAAMWDRLKDIVINS